jgi:death-on-curing family protein
VVQLIAQGARSTVARRVITIAQLATKAERDEDEALIMLWEAGLDSYNDPGDRLRRRDVDIALRAVGLPGTRDVADPAYWEEHLGLDHEELRSLLAELGTPMGRDAKTLPKGAASKLKRRSRTPESEMQQRIRPPIVEETIAEPFEWHVVGHQRTLRLLTEAEVEGIHWELVRDFGRSSDPIVPAGVRDPTLLASAVLRQHTSLGSETKYPTVEMAGAALLHSIVHNHAFHNGNKRTALVSMLVFLDENGTMPTCDEDELFQLVLRLAQHRIVAPGPALSDRETIHIAEWLHTNSRNVEKGERPIQWRKLIQILRAFGCELWKPSGVGNRINIRRRVAERGVFGRVRQVGLATQVSYTDDGRDAAIGTVKKIRRDLWLDEEHGIDSLGFYQRGDLSPTGFIVTYRKTLRRLARL